MSKPKAIIYIRVSTDDQAEKGISLEAQQKDCEHQAKEMGYKVVRVCKDAGRSGGTMERPGLYELLSLIEEDPEIKIVFVQHVDRLDRDDYVHQVIRKKFRENNVNIYALNQGFIDLNKPEDKMLDNILGAVGAYHRDVTIFKTMRAINQKIEQGWFPRVAPLGYKNARDENDKGIIVIDKEKASLVKLAFDLYITGEYGAETINEILYEKGFRSLTGKKLEESKLYYLLDNPFYIGKFKWKGKLHPGSHQPLITEEVFNLARSIRKSRTMRRNYERKHSFILSSFVFCKCGRRFTAEKHKKPSGRRYAYYHCTRGKKCEDSVCVPCNDLETQVEEKFKEVQFSEEFYQELLNKLRERYDSHRQSKDQEIRSLAKKKEAVLKMRDKVEQSFFNGDISKEVYKRNSQRFESEIEIYDEQILQAQSRKEINIGAFEELADFAKDVYSAYKDNGYEIKRKYLGFFWDRFIVEGRQIIEAKPTLLFRALQELQNPPVKEDSVSSKSNCKNVGQSDLNPQTVRFIQGSKNFEQRIINPPVWGA